MRRSIKPTVMRVMGEDLTARENDNHLMYAVCREMGYQLLPEQLDLINRLPNFASIVRARAKLQEQGRFLPSPTVGRERRKHRQPQLFAAKRSLWKSKPTQN
jgi:hypothetical protein